MSSPVLYVLAGPNGIGKTTSAYDLLPQSLPVINSDEIVKQIRTIGVVKINTQEYSNREAQMLVQAHLEQQRSFGIETNLADEETWKFLKGVKEIGYRVHLVYLSTDDLSLLDQRIKERTLRGEHFVRPDIVEECYYVSLKLLSHYFSVPDVIELIDNSSTLKRVAQKKGDDYKIIATQLPIWFTNSLLSHFIPKQRPQTVKNLSSIEDVRKHYQQKQKGNDEPPSLQL